MTNHRILIIEDDDTTRATLAECLTRLGADVRTAEDGAEAPDLVVQHRFDLLILDLYMPGMNGFEFLRQIRRGIAGLKQQATARTVPVIIISGESHDASIAHAKRLGANDYLVKPVNLNELKSAVQQQLNAVAR